MSNETENRKNAVVRYEHQSREIRKAQRIYRDISNGQTVKSGDKWRMEWALGKTLPFLSKQVMDADYIISDLTEEIDHQDVLIKSLRAEIAKLRGTTHE